MSGSLSRTDAADVRRDFGALRADFERFFPLGLLLRLLPERGLPPTFALFEARFFTG